VSDPLCYNPNDANVLELRALIAERTVPLVVWVGAGLSADAGLPSWSLLRQGLADRGQEKASSLEPAAGQALERQLSAIADLQNPWQAFERLEEELGSTTYESHVRSAFIPSLEAEIPRNYELLWRLPVSGVISLNLDALAARAHSQAHGGGKYLTKLVGAAAARTRDVLYDSTHFLAQPHGVLEDRSSWVFTRSELRKLTSETRYGEFVRQVMASCANLFLGITVDDIAVGGFLEALRADDVSVRRCFWYSSRDDVETDLWAERSRVRLIRYSPRPDHTTAVTQLLTDLLAASPTQDDLAPPVAPDVEQLGLKSPTDAIPGPIEILSQTVDVIRTQLNAEASRILTSGTDQALSEYEEFCAAYEEAIYRCWYVSDRPPGNHLFGYTLENEIAAGAFGRVFRATDSQGHAVAVKLLRHEIRSKPELLQSFRRGVRSMEILSERGIQAMVSYRSALEIPSCVIMDWIEGVNLAQAKESTTLDDWDHILKVAQQLASVLAQAHALPERVLHRDLRPANVMLQNYWSGEEFDVVVLDFDLSWHVGAEQRSVQYSTALGYLAPEQRISGKASTRSGLVDSYGLGMTFFYLLTGTDPAPGQHLYRDYLESVHSAASTLAATPWRSLPARFARLTYRMTLDVQSERPDMVQIGRELSVLRDAHLGIPCRKSAEVVMEELAARSAGFDGYAFDEDDRSITAPNRRGIDVVLRPDIAGDAIELEIAWRRTGIEDRTRLNKFVRRAHERLLDVLRKAGWSVDARLESGQSIGVSATVSSRGDIDLDGLAASVDSALSQIQFS